MGSMPTTIDMPAVLMSTISPNALGTVFVPYAGAMSGEATWPTTNMAIYIPIQIGYNYTCVKMLWYNGTVAGNRNVDVGLYDSQGNQLWHSGSTTTSGTSAVQAVTTGGTVAPGLYYMAMSVNGTASDVFRRSNASQLNLRASGVFTQTSAFPLPATATFTPTVTPYVPYLAMTSNTVV